MRYVIALGFLFISFNTSFSQIVVLQPNASVGKDAFVGDSHNANSNFANIPDLRAWEWSTSDYRSFLEFDLTGITPGTPITSATLTLFGTNSSSNPSPSANPCLSGPNPTFIEQVTSAWNENNITWNNQPGVTTLNQVSVPAHCGPLDVITVDVTAIVQDMIDNPSTNFGFRWSQQIQTPNRAIIVGSSDNTNPALRPRLEIDTTSPIPSISQWGLFILGMIMSIVAIAKLLSFKSEFPTINRSNTSFE